MPSLSFHTHTTNQLTYQSPIMAGDLRPQPSQQRLPQSDTMRTLHRCWLPTRATTASSSNTANLTRTSLTHPRYGWQHPWADDRTQQFDPRPHDPQVACNSGDRTFRGTPTNVAIPTTPFQTLETRLGELHATFPRHHNIRHRKGLQRHYAQPSARNTQRAEDAYDTRNPGSLTRPRVQPRHEDTNDAG